MLKCDFPCFLNFELKMESGVVWITPKSDLGCPEMKKQASRQTARAYASKGDADMFKAIMYFPTDEKMMKMINREIAVVHCSAVIKYMNVQAFDNEHKAQLIDSLINDLSSQVKE